MASLLRGVEFHYRWAELFQYVLAARVGNFVGEIRIGERYRKVGAALIVWRVIAVVADLSGMPHCRIVNESDRTNIKLISEKILANPKFYQPVAQP